MEQGEENRVGWLVLMLSRTILKNRNRHMAEIGLTSGQADCLRFCLERGEGTVTELKDFLGVTHQTAQGLVRRLADKELLTLRRDPRDARCQRLSLTAAGREAARQMIRSRERTGGRLLRGLTPAERQELIRLLAAVYANARQQEQEETDRS